MLKSLKREYSAAAPNIVRAGEIKAGRSGQLAISPAELAGIDRGLEDARLGRFASAEDLAAVRAP